MNFEGLNSEEVRERVSSGQVNTYDKHKSKTIKEIFIENIFSVFNFVILSIIIFVLYFYFTSGDFRLILDSIGILIIAVLNTFIAIYQEIKAKRALDKVKLLLKKEVIVLRNGVETPVDPSDVVRDDVIKIRRGDQIIVDGEVLFSNHLEIDESLLTGESNPIHKKEKDEVLSGSFCLSGNGFYKARKVGSESFAAGITSQAKKYKFVLTPLQRKIDMIVKILFGIALALVILEISMNKGGFNVDFVRKISTILISLVPQGLVLMASVTFAIGVYRISKLGAIIQKLNAIESFSNVQVVCMDKTGTLTQNKLSVRDIYKVNGNYGKEEIRGLIGAYAGMTSDKNATIEAIGVYPVTQNIERKDELPFSSERKFSMVKAVMEGEEICFVLGAYDILVNRLSPLHKAETEKVFFSESISNYRNLLFGKAVTEITFENLKEDNNSFEIEPFCIISVTDKIREDVFDAIKLFEKNDISIKILSGDSAKAIQEVSNEIGWKINDSDLISGDELGELNDKDFLETVKEKVIFARLKPEHKLRIIRSLRKDKIYTAMIGDGVNDLPAIKEADLGVAMEEGSSITKDIADIVLLKNKFSLMPAIFDEGNKIVNTVKAVGKLFITKNFFVIYISLLSLFFLLDFPLTPRRVSLINIFGIGLPAFIITLRNNNVEKTKNFLADVISFVVLSALVIVAAGYSGIYFAQKNYNVSERDLQMIMLTIIIITNIANYFAIVLKKDDESKLVYLGYGLVILFLYLFLAASSFQSGIIHLVKRFYEIDYINPVLWPLILTISLISSLIIFYLQKLREKVFKNILN
ncbi:MAG: HAD-IC family P-type ATPase [Bacteroidetes bacterium]|nr:HAD-IC family P-type ATPase [Bacteroidota bacterium]